MATTYTLHLGAAHFDTFTRYLLYSMMQLREEGERTSDSIPSILLFLGKNEKIIHHKGRNMVAAKILISFIASSKLKLVFVDQSAHNAFAKIV